LKAVLADRPMTIRELAALRPGATVTFSTAGGARVELRAAEKTLAHGRVGRLGDIIAVKLETTVMKSEAHNETEAA